MRKACTTLGTERATPHDPPYTRHDDHGPRVWCDAMNRIQNHREGGIAGVYDGHGYAEENKRIMGSGRAKEHPSVKGVGAPTNVLALINRVG